ncbi:hypothetical protein O3M35_009679 [Rhynocoris fuscipes]|uniref:Major facilitator superfamily (MFS) profile domain-containing protein n=1 Tax=Rhynocoris fuscipes TaxID=488301 RepID=A0AAW1D3V1_9HEMI
MACGRLNQHISAFLASIAVLGVGCTVGWTTPILKKLKQPGATPVHITNSESSWIAAAHEVGHFVSPLPAGYALVALGRTKCILVGAIIACIGWVLVLLAKSVTVLYISRFLFGLSMGIIFTTVPLYIAEVSPASSRGALSTLFQGMLYLGHLIEFSTGPFVQYDTLGYVSIAIALFWLLSTFFLVETPQYLISVNKRDEAKKTLTWLLGTNDHDTIHSEIYRLEEMCDTSSNGNRWRELFSSKYRTKLLVVVMVAVAQRFTGMSAVVAYASTTFSSSKGGLNADEYTILFGAIVFVFTFVSAALIDRLGRRPLILLSCIGCAIAHFITCIYFYMNLSGVDWLPFVTITIFSVLYSLGLGPIVNTLQGELFPPDIKGVASSLTTIAHAASSFVVTKLFQVIRDSVGMYLNFLVFAISCTISSFFAHRFVPETKRMLLLDTQKPS